MLPNHELSGEKMSHNKFNTKKTMLSLAMGVVLTSSVYAQDTVDSEPAKRESLKIEKILVTSQKRVQSLNEVPIAVTVVGGDKIDRQGINGLEEMSAFAPNVQINEGATQQTVFIRGIGSGANHGFEQSVGTFIDGVYFGRGRSSRNPFLDIERIEVLKGPQGVLFGKNTIAGALNIETRKPTDDFEGMVAGEYHDGTGEYGLTGLVSGELTDTVNARLVANVGGMDGYVSNRETGNKEPETEEYTVRATFVWAASDDLNVTFKAEASAYDVIGRHAQLVAAGQYQDFYDASDANFETELDFYKSAQQKGKFGKVFDNTETQNFSLTLDYSLGDHEITSITSNVGYEYNNNISADFAVVDSVTQRNHQKHDQFSQELRIASPFYEKFNYIAGVFYQKETLDFTQILDFDFTEAKQIIADNDLSVSFFPFSLFSGGRATDLTQDTESFAAFAQGTYNITDALNVTVGLRYTNDEKELDKSQFMVEHGTTNPHQGAMPWKPHDQELERKDTELSPSFNVKYNVSDDTMIYATYSEGFKSGGFDFENVSGNLDTAQFEPETVKSQELGIKTTLADGAATLNVALFKSEFDGLQVSAWNGSSFEVDNAGITDTQGIEADGVILLTEDITLSGTIAYLAAEYGSFEGATCANAQKAILGGGCTQDLTGKDLQFSPELSGNIALEYVAEVFDELELVATIDVNFTSSFYTAQDLDPVSKQSGFAKVNAQVEILSDESWSIALIAKNITDRKTTTWVNDTPLTPGSFFALIDPPRTIGVQGRVYF